MGVREVRAGYSAVTPWIIGADTAGLIDYVSKAFGGEEIARIDPVFTKAMEYVQSADFFPGTKGAV